MMAFAPATRVQLTHGRGWLTASAAASIHRIDRQIGHPLQITEAGRTWDEQNAHWVRYQNGTGALALHPDTPSVHQIGDAVDSNEAQRILDVMHDHGWRRTVYRWINGVWTLVEEWHFEHFNHLDNHRGQPAGGGAVQFTPHEEDEMLMLILVNSQGEHHVAMGKGLLRHFIGSDPYDLIMKVSRSADDWQRVQAHHFPALCRTYGIDIAGDPSPAYRWSGASFQVLNPLTGRYGHGNLWTAENVMRAQLAKR